MKALAVVLIAALLLIAGCGKNATTQTTQNPATGQATESVNHDQELSDLDKELQEADSLEQDMSTTDLDAAEEDLGTI